MYVAVEGVLILQSQTGTHAPEHFSSDVIYLKKDF